MNTSPSKKRLLFILRNSPYGNVLAKEALDAVLASSAYEQDLSVLFMDDGVFQLLKEQKPNMGEQKNIYKMISAFSMYDIDQLFVCEASLKQRGLTVGHIFPEVKTLSTQEVQQLTSRQDHLLSF